MSPTPGPYPLKVEPLLPSRAGRRDPWGRRGATDRGVGRAPAGPGARVRQAGLRGGAEGEGMGEGGEECVARSAEKACRARPRAAQVGGR